MSVSLYKIAIESHTFYRKWKKKKIVVLDNQWPLIICNPWIMTTGLGFWGPYQAGENSHTFDLLGLSLESCEDFKAHTGIKDSINLTYTVDGQCSQLFLRGVRIHTRLVCFLWRELSPSPALSLLGSEACWSNDIRHSPGYQVCFNFVSFSQKQCVHHGLCQELI